MTILGPKNKPWGAKFTAAEQKAFDAEFKRQMVVNLARIGMELEACCLWALHETAGYGKLRLRRYHDAYIALFKSLMERYDTDNDDNGYLALEGLKSIGVDLVEWRKQDGVIYR